MSENNVSTIKYSLLSAGLSREISFMYVIDISDIFEIEYISDSFDLQNIGYCLPVL